MHQVGGSDNHERVGLQSIQCDSNHGVGVILKAVFITPEIVIKQQRDGKVYLHSYNGCGFTHGTVVNTQCHPIGCCNLLQMPRC